MNFHELTTTLKSTDLALASAFFVFFIASWVIRGVRLKVLLLSERLPTKDLIYLSFLGQFLSFLIPLRAGEVAKSVYLYTQFKIPLAKSVVWVLIDRFLDFWTNLVLLGVLVLATQSQIPKNLSYSLFFVFTTFTLAGLLIIFKSEVGQTIIKLSKTERLIYFSKVIIDGFLILRRKPVELLSLSFLSIAALITDALSWLVVFKALKVDLNFLQVFLGSLLSALTFLIPAAPGYVGSAQVSTLAVFSGILALPVNLSSAAAVLYHVLMAIALLVSGIICLHLLKFDLNLVWKQIKRG